VFEQVFIYFFFFFNQLVFLTFLFTFFVDIFSDFQNKSKVNLFVLQLQRNNFFFFFTLC